MSTQLAKLEADWLEYFSLANLADETPGKISTRALNFFCDVRDIVESLLANSEAASITYDQQLNQLETQASKVRLANERISQEKLELQESHSQLEEAISKLQIQNRELFQSKSQLELEINELQTELSEKRNQLRSISMYDSFSNQAAQTQLDELKSVQEKFYKLRTEFIELQYKYSESESVRMNLEFDRIRAEQNLKLSNSQLTKISSLLETQQADFDALNEKYHNLLLDFNRSQSAFKELKNETQDKIKILNLQLTQKENTIASLKTQNEETQTKYLSESSASMYKIAELENLMSLHLTQNKRVETLLKESSNTIAKIQEESQNNVKSLEIELLEAKTELEESKKKIEELNNSLESTQIQVSDLIDQNFKTNSAQTIDSESVILEENSSNIISRVAELQKNNLLYSTQLAAEKVKNRQLKVYFEQLESQIERSSLSLQEQRTQYEVVCDKLQVCQHELSEMADLVESQNTELVNNKIELLTLEKRVKYLTERLQVCLSEQLSAQESNKLCPPNRDSEWIVNGLRTTWTNLYELIDSNQKLSQRLEDLEAQSASYEQIKKDCVQLQDRCVQHEQMKSILDKKIDTLNSLLEQLKFDYHQQQLRIQEFESEKEKQFKTRSTLQSDSSDQKEQQSNSDKREELSGMSLFVDQARKLSEELCKEISQKNQLVIETSKTQSELLRAQSELQSYIEICRGYEKQIQDSRNEMAELNNLLEKHMQNINQLIVERDEKNQQIFNLNSDLNFVSLRLQLTEQQSAKYVEELARVRSERMSWEKLNVELNALSKDTRTQSEEQKNHYENIVLELRAQLAESVDQIKNKKLEFERLESDFKVRIEKSDQKIKVLEEQIAVKNTKIGTLENQFDVTKSDLKYLENEFFNLQQIVKSYEQALDSQVFDDSNATAALTPTIKLSNLSRKINFDALTTDVPTVLPETLFPTTSRLSLENSSTPLQNQNAKKTIDDSSSPAEPIANSLVLDKSLSGHKTHSSYSDKLTQKASSIAAANTPFTPNILNVSQLLQTLKATNSKVSELEKLIETQSLNLEAKEYRLAFLQEQNASYESQISEYNSTIKLLEEEYQASKNRFDLELSEKKHELAQLKQSLADLEASSEQVHLEYAELKKISESNSTRLQELDDENSKLISQLESSSSIRITLESALKEKQFAYEDLLIKISENIRQNRELEQKYLSTTDELNETKSALLTAETQLKNLQLIDNEKMNSLQVENSNLKSSLEEARVQLSEFVVSTKRLTEELKYWKKMDANLVELDSASTESSTIKSLNDCNAWLNRQYETASNKIQILEQQVFILENKLSAQSEQLEAVRKNNSVFDERQLKDLETLVQRFPNVQAAIDKIQQAELLQESNQVLRKKSQEYQNSYQSAKELHLSLKSQLVETKQLLESALLEKENFSVQLEWTRGELLVWQKRVEELIEKYKNHDPELTKQYEIKVEMLSEEKAKLMRQIDELKRQNEECESKLNQSIKNLQTELKSSNNALEEFRETSTQKLKTLRQKNKKLVELARKNIKDSSDEISTVPTPTESMETVDLNTTAPLQTEVTTIDIGKNESVAVETPIKNILANDEQDTSSKETLSVVQNVASKEEPSCLESTELEDDTKSSTVAKKSLTTSNKSGEKPFKSFVNKFLSVNTLKPSENLVKNLFSSLTTTATDSKSESHVVESSLGAVDSQHINSKSDDAAHSSLLAEAVSPDVSETHPSASNTTTGSRLQSTSEQAELEAALKTLNAKKIKYLKSLEKYYNGLSKKKSKAETSPSNHTRSAESSVTESAKSNLFSSASATSKPASFVKPFSQLAKKSTTPVDKKSENLTEKNSKNSNFQSTSAGTNLDVRQETRENDVNEVESSAAKSPINENLAVECSDVAVTTKADSSVQQVTNLCNDVQLDSILLDAAASNTDNFVATDAADITKSSDVTVFGDEKSNSDTNLAICSEATFGTLNDDDSNDNSVIVDDSTAKRPTETSNPESKKVLKSKHSKLASNRTKKTSKLVLPKLASKQSSSDVPSKSNAANSEQPITIDSNTATGDAS